MVRVLSDPWRSIVEAHFRVYETRQEPMPGIGEAHMYYLMFAADELEAKYEAVRAAILAESKDSVVFMRHDGGEDVLVVAPRPPVKPEGSKANIVLFLLTIATTVMAGAMYWQGYKHVGDAWRWSVFWSPEHLLWGGITFALPLMLILGIHEMAHYIAARRHGLRATLPFFLPFPPFALPIGTLGAFIRLKDPLPNRKALFDVGASGPLAGFIIAVPVLLIGAALTSQAGIVVPEIDVPHVSLNADYLVLTSGPGELVLSVTDPAPGTVLLMNITAPDGEDRWEYEATVTTHGDGNLTETTTGKLAPGTSELRSLTVPNGTASMEIVITWDDHLIRFGDPLLVTIIDWFDDDDRDLLTHPTFFAGWVGLLITGINLLPAGQLDGGHVARAVFGDRMKYVAYAAVGALFYFAFQFQSWILMALFIVFMGLNHPPPLNDRVQLDAKRKVLAVVILLVFVLTFVPRPVIL